ncbi:MAG: hypothetical protein ACP5PO_06595, partial [Desulfurella sp.]
MDYKITQISVFIENKKGRFYNVTKILKENNITFPLPEDLRFLAKKAATIRAHLERNPKDLDSKKG